MTRSNRIGAPACLAMMGWLSLVLWLDSDGPHWLQRALGAGTWVVLAYALSRVTPVVRVQTLVVVAFASLVEFLASPTFHVYVYRFDNVPMYVPPGHGLVYLSAFALGHTAFVERHRLGCTSTVLALGGMWSGYGLFLADRPDALGAFWFGCLVLFLFFGPSKAVYLGAFVVVSYLELVGTGFGNWVWQTTDPTGGVSIGNPPSGAAGGYGWFDLVALVAAPYLLRLVPDRFSRGLPPEPLSAPSAGRVDAH